MNVDYSTLNASKEGAGMPDYKEILYEKQRSGALITRNRREAMNAISRSMIKELHEALDDVEQDKDVRAVVLTGAGRAFSSGMDQGNRVGRRRDIHWPYGIVTGQTAAEVIDSWRVDPRNFRRMWEFGKPIIGAINRSEEHTSELQSRGHLVCRLLLEKKKDGVPAPEKAVLADATVLCATSSPDAVAELGERGADWTWVCLERLVAGRLLLFV